MIRLMVDSDQKWVFTNWLHSARDLVPFRDVDRELYFINHGHVIAGCLSKHATLMFCDDEDQDVLYGFLNFNPVDLSANFVYVKYASRQFGIAKKLFKHVFGDQQINKIHCSHRPRIKGKPALEETFKKRFSYNPYLLAK